MLGNWEAFSWELQMKNNYFLKSYSVKSIIYMKGK